MLQIGERGRREGNYRIAELNADGVLQSVGSWVNKDQAVADGYQELFELDLNNDGKNHMPTAVDLDQDGFVDGLAHYRLMGDGKAVNLTNKRGKALTDKTSRFWNAVASKQVGDGFQVLLQGEIGRRRSQYRVWSTDANGKVINKSSWLSGEALAEQGYEQMFNRDFNNDETILTPATVNKSLYLAPHSDYMKADGIQIKANQSLALSGEMTTSFWLKRDPSQSFQSVQGIFQSYMLGIRDDGTPDWSGVAIGRPSIPEHKWTHISAVVRHLGAEQYQVELYVNGHQEGTIANTPGVKNTQNDISFLPAGRFDNIQIWNSALNESELQRVANNQGFDIRRDSLIAEYTFENDTGGTNASTYDSSGKNNHGFLLGEKGGTLFVDISNEDPNSPDQKVLGITSQTFADNNGDGFIDDIDQYIIKGFSQSHGIILTDERGERLTSKTSRSWNAISAAPNPEDPGSGFEVLVQGERGRRRSEYQVWSTNDNGKVTSRSVWFDAKAMSEQGYETTFNKDFDDDKFIGVPSGSYLLDEDRNGLVDEISHYALLKGSGGTAEAIDLKDGRGNKLSDASSRSWNVVYAFDNGDDFDILIQGERGRRQSEYMHWKADQSGLVKENYRWLSANQLALDGFETIFGHDFNDNGTIGL